MTTATVSPSLPLRPSLALTAALLPWLLAACGGGSDNTTTTRYVVGGQVSGLQQGELVLQNNGADDLKLRAGTAEFSFHTLLEAGQPYAVTVATQPAGLHCTVASGSGAVQGDVRDVRVQCAAIPGPGPGPGTDPGDGPVAGGGGSSDCLNRELLSPGARFRWHMVGPAGPLTASMVQDMEVRQGASFAGHGNLLATQGTMTLTTSAGQIPMRLTHYNQLKDTPQGPVVVEYGSTVHMSMDMGAGTMSTDAETVYSPAGEQRRFTLQPGESDTYRVTGRSSARTTVAGHTSRTEAAVDESSTTTYLGQKTVTVAAGTFKACHYEIRYSGDATPWEEYRAVGSGLPLVMVGEDEDGGRVRFEMQGDSHVNGIPVGQYHAARR